MIDRDVDDTMAMLSCVLEEIPEADAGRVFAHGGSRGGAVTLVLSVRDERIQAAVEFFAASDHTLPSIQANCEALAAAGGGSGSNAVSNHAWIYAAEPYLAGTLGLAEARRVLLACSMAFFAHRLPLRLPRHGGPGRLVLSERLVEVTDLESRPGLSSSLPAGDAAGSCRGAPATEDLLCDAMSGCSASTPAAVASGPTADEPQHGRLRGPMTHSAPPRSPRTTWCSLLGLLRSPASSSTGRW